MTDRCSACDATALVMHLRVRDASVDDGLIPTTDAFGAALSDVVRCTACGHMQLEQMPSDTRLEGAYADAASDDYVEEEAGQRATARAILEQVERQVRPGRLADLGCWVGFLAAEARDRGWEVVGVEPSRFASGYARERLGLDVRTGDLLAEPLPEGAFDAVVLGDVIEHLPDPGAALERVTRLLAPDGALVLMLPDAGSRLARRMGRRWWSVLPTHVQYFTRASLRTLLGRHGFAVRSVATQPKAFTVRYYLGRIGGYSPPLARAVVAAADRAGVADRLWAPDFRDRMLVIATGPRRGANGPS